MVILIRLRLPRFARNDGMGVYGVPAEYLRGIPTSLVALAPLNDTLPLSLRKTAGFL